MAKGIFSRMTDIVKANINDMLDGAEDPEKMIRQMVIEMEEGVNKATMAVGSAVANAKRLRRQHDQKASEAEGWHKKAQLAVEKGNDDLARKALQKRSSLLKAANDLKPALEEAERTADQLKDQLNKLKAKLDEARIRQGTLIARHQAAKSKREIYQSVSGIGDDAFSSFERFENKIEGVEAEADAHAELAGESESLESEFAALEADDDIEDELAALKSGKN